MPWARLKASVALAHAVGAAAAGEEEVVDDERVEVRADEGADLPQLRAHGRVVVAEGLKQALLGRGALRRGDDGGQTALHLDAVGPEDPAAHLDLLVTRQLAAPGLQVHPVQPQVLLDERQLRLQLIPRDPRRRVGDEVGRQPEIAIVAHLYTPLPRRAVARSIGRPVRVFVPIIWEK